MRKLPRLVRIALPLAALAVSLVAPSASTAAPRGTQPPIGTGTVTVMTFNMCGQHCNDGSTGAVIDNLAQTIEGQRPNAVLLQEVCNAQFAALVSKLADDGTWVMDGAHDVTEKHGCDGAGNTFGDAVLLHGGGMPEVQSKSLPYPHGKKGHQETRKVLCLRANSGLPRAGEVCTLHAGLSFQIGAAHQAKQIKVAYSFARGLDRQIPLILGGDFNVVPSANALDPVYSKGGGGASGAMEEVDACPGKNGRAHHSKTCNRTTHDAYAQVKHRTKNDYIFGSGKSFKNLSAQVKPSSYSDHDMLIGSLFLCSTGSC